MSRFSLLLGLVLGASAAGAQTGRIVGAVTEYGAQMALPGAHVLLEGIGYGAATRSDGTFVLEGIEPGIYVLVATSVGFEPAREAVIVRPRRLCRVGLPDGPRAVRARPQPDERHVCRGAPACWAASGFAAHGSRWCAGEAVGDFGFSISDFGSKAM